jgi:hypothetical protein
MATGLTFQTQDPNDHHYLKPFVPLSRRNACYVPLGLRRSVSLEDRPSDNNSNFLKKPQTKNSLDLPLQNSSLSSSLQSLCFRLRPHQLLPEFNKSIAKSDDEHKFDWWNSAAHLRPLIENIILYENLSSHFEDDLDKQDKNLIKFKKCKRNGRRNGVCFGIDRLYYNEQMILFVAISNEVQIAYNLLSSGFKI